MGVEIKVENLTKAFGKDLIWGDVTLTIPAGEVCVMLGPSGTGKSVFLKCLIGLLKPDNGSIVIQGTDIATCSAGRRCLRPGETTVSIPARSMRRQGQSLA